MSYIPKINADTLTLYLGVAATGRATASSTTLDMVSFGTIYNPRPDITFTADDVGMPIAIVGGGPVDADMPPVYFVQGALFHTTIAAYVSPTEVTLTDAPDTSIFNTGFATVILYRPCVFAADWSNAPVQFQLQKSISPGTNNTLQFSIFASFNHIANPYVDRFGPPLRGQPVYLVRDGDGDDATVEEFGGFIGRLTTYTEKGVDETFAWSAQCSSWSALARRRVVPPAIPTQFANVAGDVVFRQVVLDYLSNDGVAVDADSAPNISLGCPVGSNVGQLLDQIVSQVSSSTSAWYWTTDAWRTYLLKQSSAVAAPWDVTSGDDLLTGDTPYQQQSEVSTDQLANSAYATGQFVLLNTIEATFVGDGTNATLNMPAPIGTTPVVTLNSGSPLAVGILGVDTGKLWYWSQDSTALTPDASNTPLTSSDSLLVVFTPAVPATAQAFNVGSLQELQAVEATSANYDYSISVADPILPADLLALCYAYETEYGMPAITNTLYTLRPGLDIGQLQHQDYAPAGIVAGDYLIASIRMTIVQNVLVWQYTAFGGANIGNAITALTQFINRQAPGGIITPSVPITGPADPIGNNFFAGGSQAIQTITFPQNVTAGNLLVIVVSQNTGLINPQVITDSLGNTWTQGAFGTDVGLFPNRVALSWTIASVSGPCTVSYHNATGGNFAVIGEFSGIKPTSPVDTFGSGPGTAPTLTTTEDGDLIVTGIIMDSSATDPTVVGPEALIGFRLGGSSAGDVAASHVNQSSAGAFTSTLASTAGSVVYVSVAFKRKAAAAPPAQTIQVFGNPGGGGGSSPLTTKGDIFGFSTTNDRIPVGPDGYVLTADSGAALGVSYQSPGGAGGVAPNPASSAPTASVPFSGWTLQNVSNAHCSLNDFMPNELCLSVGNFATVQWGGMTRTLSVPYTLIATIQMRGVLSGDQSTFNASVGVSDGTKYEAIGVTMVGGSANIAVEVRTLANLSSTGSQIAGPTASVVGPTLSVKITNDSTHRTFFYWKEGSWVQLLQEATGTFLTETEAAVISLCDIPTGGYSLEVAIRYWSQ